MRDFQTPGRSAVFAANGMCATSHPLAAATAVDILKSGGNAVDAAIAAAVLLGICEPQMTGIGGDCFALISKPGEDVIGINGSGRAPTALDTAALREAGHKAVPPDHIASVTVPGAMHAFCTMSEAHGRLGLDRLLAPAIRYADEGVPVAPRTAFDWAEGAAILQGAARRHYLVQGAVPKVGTMFRAPGQAEVLRRVAAEGPAGFYDGEVAEDMLTSLAGLGGAHDADDFGRIATDRVDPISGRYGSADLIELPPNGQGATAILMAAILSQFDLAGMDPLGADRAHVEAEAAKLAYDARNRFLADADHVTRIEHMLDPDTARRLAGLIEMDRALPDPMAAAGHIHRDTVYLTVVDRDRMAVSLIYSIFHSFGSGMASDRFGILFQNRGAGFALDPAHPNDAAGGKRPMHTIIPAMLAREGRVAMPFGVMGGAYQPAGHARVLANIESYGMDPQAAIDAPRSFPEAGRLTLETGYPESVAADLAGRGHDVVRAAAPLGGAQAIAIHTDGVLEGASDPRKDGLAIGY
ncbi:gamma-glutamyltransferase family protein [Mesobaculum littorinae]|uniref:Gamma-glutamyltransferase family protein n=1 Tax=Mesobaculum littorinae TaxID=2486419 RepID=A0A438ADB0_9RHOB|nr:gamma-glutamyltransferase family protein [Mesobaculum littorinae]RVV96686.1 gamma-glutamyltransferase family protein [Mesobaculum littorinae]